MIAASSVKSADRISHHEDRAIVSNVSLVYVTSLYCSEIFSLFFSINATISSLTRASRRNTRHRDKRALLMVKLGFSVVAPMRETIPFSTNGRSVSCWALFHRWISSRKTIVGLLFAKFDLALVMIFMISSFFDTTPERWKKSPSDSFDITYARVVFPVPGHHQNIIDGMREERTNFRITPSLPISFSWPTISSKELGRKSDGSGVSIGWRQKEWLDCIQSRENGNQTGKKQVDWKNINREYTRIIIHVISMWLTSWELAATITLYTIIFVILMIFMELRLRVLHKHHAQKIHPVDDSWLVEIDRKLRFFVHSLFFMVYILSVSLIVLIV